MTEQKISDFIACVMAALSNRALYEGKHPIVDEFTERAFGLLKDLYADDVLSLTVIGDSLVFNNNPVTEKGLHLANFIKRLKKKGIEKIEIQKGVTTDELKRFISAMISRETSFSSPHISVGIVEVRVSSERFSLRTLIEENIARIREVFQTVSPDAHMEIGSLEETVMGLISTLKRETNVLSLLNPVKTYDEYTYVHAANVSILTLFQAETLGISEELACDIGLAGLLHDVGKMFVPREVLDKRSKLDPDEWKLMKLHPIYGARYLSALPDMPRLSMIVAYEHHMKFDRSGYPDSRQNGSKPHLVSQIVSISDFFDALRTERPYRKPVEAGIIINLLREGSGKDFNPVLVDSFIASLKEIKAI